MANLHVFTGDHAADTVRAAMGIRDGEYLVQHDVISCGPLSDYRTRAEWRDARLGFWLGLSGEASFDPGTFPNDLVEEAHRLREADRVTLWVGAGLSDRLLLPSVVHLADIEGFALPRVDVVEVVRHATLSVPALGWGMLRPKDVGRPEARTLTPADLDEARRVWSVITSADPASLPEYLEDAADATQVHAMSTLIERYPDSTKGLSHWDASLLSALPNAETSGFAVVGGAIGANNHHLDPVGDMYLFWRLRRMAESPEPLVTLRADRRITNDALRDSRVQPTELGVAVRDGRANQASRNGIDDWIGGVHLHAATGSPWYRRNGTLTPEAA